MTIDKQKLQKLLWSEVASWKADCGEWKQNAEALGEFLGEKTVEEVALELLAENDRLSASPERQIIRAAVTEAVKGIADAAAADAKAGTLKEIEQLKAENEALRLRCDRLDEDKQAMTETHVLYTWLRKKCDQPSNDFVAVQMNIGHDWVPVHDLDRDLRSMIEREEP
ncbi:hypothetical protein SAMN05216509_5324 [Pseudomonas sp. B10]|uniref:hypothetical protein n=1 Tax=Pseudomonas sp. B10 TaxID=118613 RepID=UPI0009537830|nr:hypothetical protein [Pseudomonas sp. B10]SIR83971.1 hypothetical protein SAMN05216509_5324 [Pseudomonas sp. B10]